MDKGSNYVDVLKEERQALLDARRDRFVSRYGLKLFCRRDGNIARLMMSAPGDLEIRRRLARAARSYRFDFHLFDHPEVWGRNGWPFFLVGHAYSIHGDDLDTLAALHLAGLNVTISSDSWYSTATVLVSAYHPSVLRWPSVQTADGWETPSTFDARSLLPPTPGYRSRTRRKVRAMLPIVSLNGGKVTPC
jgi:hypothetical protein